DRSAALQRAVRRPGLLRDQGRQDHRDAEGRRLSDEDDGFLELDGHDRRKVELRNGRELLRWKGSARTDRRRESRLRAGALPQHQRHQHREEGVMKHAPDSRVLSREQAQALIERTVKLSKADSIEVTVGGGYNANVRFADNRISTAGGVS